MYLFPYTAGEVKIINSKERVLQNVLGLVESVEQFTLTKRKKLLRDYEGIVKSKGFKIRRIPNFGYTAFAPIIEGRFNEENKLELRVYFHKYINYLLLLFFGFKGLNLYSKFNLQGMHGLVFNDFIGFLIPYFIVLVLFNYEIGLFKKNAHIFFQSQERVLETNVEKYYKKIANKLLAQFNEWL
jgi:hypothetical protein